MPHSPAATGQRPKAPRRTRPLSYWLSIVLFCLFVGGIIAFFWLGAFFAGQRTPPPAKTSAGSPEAVDERSIVVRSIVLKKRTEKGKVFVLRAVRIVQPEKDGKVVRLLDVVGEITRDSGGTLTFRADEAIYHEDADRAELKGNVVIRDPGRWTLTSTLVHVDTKKQILTSKDPVTVKLNSGVIHARGMQAEKDTGRIVFKGPVSSSFEVETTTESTGAAENTGKADATGETAATP